ncbi:MAG TPA: trigger factor [Thermoanaerobaculia bacterium]|nr:trigger factor [Thermoanaerobaculia bacterium]
MSVILSNAEVGPSRRELKIEIPAPAVEAERLRVLEAFRKRVQLPGFRRGKAPSTVVERRYQQDIDQEVLDRLLPRYWRQAEAEAGIQPLLPPGLGAVDEVKTGQPVIFVATVDIRPEIELRNYQDFELPTRDDRVNQEEVDKALEDLRMARSHWHVVERKAAAGDLVQGELLALDPAAADEAPAEPQRVQFEIGHPSVWEELSVAATGLAAGSESRLVRTEDRGEEGKVERSFELKVAAVRERHLPEASDELAQQVGLADLAALREGLEQRLGWEKKAETQALRERAVMDQLCERHPLVLPEAVVEQELKAVLTDYAEHLMRQGVDIERAEIDWAKMAEDLRPQAARRVQSRLLLDAVAEKEAIEVSEADFEAAIATLARRQGRPTPAVRKELDEAGKLSSLKAQLRRERVLRRLTGGVAEPTAESAP